MQRLIALWVWYLKQLLPLTYRSHYETKNSCLGRNEYHFVVWRMWLGRSFDIEDVIVA